MFLDENPINTWGIADYLVFAGSLSTRLAVEFVIVFFVLSGFSIAYSLKRNNNTLSFYKKRLIRIYPPYVLALVWAGIVYVITLQLQPEFYQEIYSTATFSRYQQMSSFFDVQTIFKNLVYLPSEGFIVQFWSLTYEVIFYLLAPLFVINKKWYYRASIVLFLAYLILHKNLEINASIPMNYLGIYNFFFCLGMMLLDNFSRISKFLLKLGKAKSIAVIILTLLITYAINFLFKGETIWSFLPAGIMACLLIIFFLSYQIRIKWLIQLGKHSYSLYITHFASIILFHSIYFAIVSNDGLPHIRNYLVFFMAIPVCLLISYAFYLIVEKKTKEILSKYRQSA